MTDVPKPLPVPDPPERVVKLTRLRRHQAPRDLSRLLIVFAVILGACVATLAGTAVYSLTAIAHQNARQQEGRKVGVKITCAALGAVIDAGRRTITSSTIVGSPRFTRNLERLGLPPAAARKAQAQLAADAYAKAIADAVRKRSGVKGVVNGDGTLNCSRLLDVSVR